MAHYPWEWAEDAAPLLEEAAAEIERLREQSHQTGVASRLVALTGAEREAAAEIERLRAVTEPMPACAASIGSVTPVEPRPLGDPEIAVEILRLRVAELEEAIRRLAEQDATLSLLCKRDGSQAVTVTMDATLTDAERSLIRRLAAACEGGHPREWTNRALTADDRATLRGLLERTK